MIARFVVVAFVVEADGEKKSPGKTTWFGKDSVHVLFADKSCAPADEVSWFAVPATVSVLVCAVYAVVSTPRVPLPPEVVTKPLLVKFESVAMFCDVLTVKLVPLYERPVPAVVVAVLYTRPLASTANSPVVRDGR